MLLCLDGVVHISDLPVQAFARRITERLPADGIRPVIAGMRGFLEGRPELIPSDIDVSAAEDGYQAVEILARAAGLDAVGISTARAASRTDLAASAWAVDPAEGLQDLLALIGDSARVLLLAGPADPAARPVLSSIELTVDEIVDAPADLAVMQILARKDAPDPDRLLMIGSSWAGELEPAQKQGCHTLLVDRFGRGRGNPSFRSPDLEGLIDPVGSWLAGRSGHRAMDPDSRREVHDNDGSR